MIKILTVIGARPQFIKAAAINRIIKEKFSNQITEVLVHTGQHYDENMSRVFFEEMNIPKENHNLHVGSSLHGKQTATMISGIEDLLLQEKPQCVLLYGDTNSTLAGAIAASKLQVPVVHVEAGLRSYNKLMPEEINRIMCDHASTLLFSPTKKGYENLIKEGFSEYTRPPYTINNPKVFHCGDVMYDNALYFSKHSEKKLGLLQQYNIEPCQYILATIHRNNNTDDSSRLTRIFKTLNRISTENKIKIVLPLHPRTSKMLQTNLDKRVYDSIHANPDFVLIPPASFLEMIVLEQNCLMVCTDSGGVQKESFFFNKPCIILRPETEWVELVENGTAIIADADEQKIIHAFTQFKNKKSFAFPPIFGDGNAAEFICKEIIKCFSSN